MEAILLSIFIMYSTDRAKALDYTISSLQMSPIYHQCQKTLVVDGKVDKIPPEWQAVQVPRINGKFCWGRMWDAGVCSSRNDKVVYLDSDRLLPSSFLEATCKILRDSMFVYTSRHYMMLYELPFVECSKLLQTSNFDEVVAKQYVGKFKYETRFGEPFHGPSKNVMSGSVGFTRNTYMDLGGVDHWYCGHGAYADSDFHMQASVNGCQFIDLYMPEIHFPHAKLNSEKDELTRKSLYKLGLDNFVYYCDKWGLPMTYAESLAVRCDISRPSMYVDKRLKLIKANAKGS